MADLQNVGAQSARCGFGEDTALGGFLGVAGLQKTAIAIGDAKHQGVVIFRRWRNFSWNDLRPQKIRGSAVPIEMISAQFVNYPRPRGGSDLFKLLLLGRSDFAA